MELQNKISESDCSQKQAQDKQNSNEESKDQPPTELQNANPDFHPGTYDNYSARNYQQSNSQVNGEILLSNNNGTALLHGGLSSGTQSQQNLRSQILANQINKKMSMLPVDRAIPSTIKGKNQFICAGSLFTVDEKYDFSKRIGHGAYGVVVSAQDKVNNTKVAIKKIPKAFQDLVDAKRVLREIKILKFFDHENIVSLFDIQKPLTPTGYDDVYIVTELMEADLHKLIYSKQKLTDDHYQYFMYQLLRGVLYLHSANIMHRDLKPSNILVNMNCDLKICDFGLARGFGAETKTNENTIYVVTRWYRAPEVMLNQQHYTEALDVWSIGCIFGELMMKGTMFQGQHNMKQLDKIVEVMGFPSDEDLAFINNEYTLNYLKRLPKKQKVKWEDKIPNANPQALDLLTKMLSFNPDKRITIAQAVQHPYFKNFQHLGAPPISESKFDWGWDQFELNKELLQRLIYMESLFFHPDQDPDGGILLSSKSGEQSAPTTKGESPSLVNMPQKIVDNLQPDKINEHTSNLVKRPQKEETLPASEVEGQQKEDQTQQKQQNEDEDEQDPESQSKVLKRTKIQ